MFPTALVSPAHEPVYGRTGQSADDWNTPHNFCPTWISSHGRFSRQLRTMWKNPFKCTRKSRNLMGHSSGMCPLRAPGDTGDMQRQQILACFNSVSWYWAHFFLWWGQSHGAAVPWSCWPSLAPVVPSPCSPSPGAAPTQSKWMDVSQARRWTLSCCVCPFYAP